MAHVHFILQKKGGIGKTFVAFLLAQYLMEKYGDCHSFDTDPLNKTSGLISIDALNVRELKVLDFEGNLDKQQFDTLVEYILSLGSDDHVVVDNGASTFTPMTSYLRENNVPQLLQKSGHNVYAHCILGAGKELQDTTTGVVELSEIFNTIVLWINPFWGKVEVNGIGFTETNFFNTHIDKFHGVIHLPQYNSLLKTDMMLLLGQAITFQQLSNGEGEGEVGRLMPKMRLERFWSEFKESCLDPIGF